MLEKFRGMGPRKLYMIFSLTDETYALLSSARAPVVDPRNFYFAIALLDQSCWILGSVIGAVAGALILQHRGGGLRHDRPVRGYRRGPVEELPEAPARRSGGRGDGAVSDCPGPFGQDQMLLISLGVIVLCLLVLRDRLDEGGRDMLSTAGAVAAIAVMAIITFLTRALPAAFSLTGGSRPKLVWAGFCHRPSSPCSSSTVSGACPLPPPAAGCPSSYRGGGGDPSPVAQQYPGNGYTKCGKVWRI